MDSVIYSVVSKTQKIIKSVRLQEVQQYFLYLKILATKTCVESGGMGLVHTYLLSLYKVTLS